MWSLDASPINDSWRYERAPLTVTRRIQPQPDPPPPFRLDDFMEMVGYPRAEAYGIHIKKPNVKAAFKKMGEGIKKAGQNVGKGFESAGKGLAHSVVAMGHCKPSDAKCIAKNLGNALKSGVELAVPIGTAVASLVGNGNPDAGYTKIGKELYSISGIEGIVQNVQAIKACKGNAACIAKNLGMLLAAVGAMASNAIPGVGEAADGAMVAATAARIAEKAEMMAQDAMKVAKTAKEIKHAEELAKAAKEAKDANNLAKDVKDVDQQKSALQKMKDLNDKMKNVQQNVQTDVPDVSHNEANGITGTDVAEGTAAAAALGAAAYGASKLMGGGGAGAGATDAQGNPVDAQGNPIGGAPGGLGFPRPPVTQPIEVNIQVAGTDGVFSSASGYDGSSHLPSAAFLIFLLIICLILVL